MKLKQVYLEPDSKAVDIESHAPICESVYCNTITDVVEENIEW